MGNLCLANFSPSPVTPTVDDAFPYQGIGHVLFSPDGATLLTSGGDGTVRSWDSQTGEQLWQLQAHEGRAITYLGLS